MRCNHPHIEDMGEKWTFCEDVDCPGSVYACKFGCTGDDVALHYGWFRCTPESRALLAEERRKLT